MQIRSDLNEPTGLDAALIFGGDGTVHRHLAQLHQHKVPTLVVPTGSGNDFAKALGISSMQTALGAWQRFCERGDNVREIDLGVIRSAEKETLFCCVASVGLDVAANTLANRMPAWLRGRGGYLLAAVWSLGWGRPVHVSLLAVEFQSSGLAWLVAAGNAHRYGGGLQIVPQARVDDGLLDVCLVDKMRKIKLLCAIPTVLWGGHTRFKEVRYFRTGRMRLESESRLEIYADGEPAGHTPAEFSVVSRALKVIVPV
ncbi:MAG: diacylglycerol/lipid kinase family protein [Actinomycetota bacterium]